MRRTILDLDALRTFRTGIDLGSFAKAADKLHRSTSAVSAQLKKLEEQAGTALLRKSGRGLVPTEAGELLLGYARRMLELNDEAQLALDGLNVHGSVRLGLQEDFGEHLLSEILGRFTRACSSTVVETRIARNTELLSLIESNDLDLALGWFVGREAGCMEKLGSYPLQWIGPADPALASWWDAQQPVPLVTFDSGCAMRATAIAALDQAGIPWRIAFTSPSLASVWKAVGAGLGITIRTHVGMPDSVRILPKDMGLPALPFIDVALYQSTPKLTPACQRMYSIIRESIAAPAPPRS